MNAKFARKKQKNIPYLSHDYIINNHGDIFTIAAMVFVIGLMFKTTTPLAQTFIMMQHMLDKNETDSTTEAWLYRPGKYDICSTIFYTLIFIIIHAVIQEYGLDRFNKKLNLTRLRLGKFNDAGQHACFFAASAFWAGYILHTEDFVTSLSSLWEGYPHRILPFWIKLFYIFQICFWIHNYPELYLQRVRKEDIPNRVLTTTIYLIGITIAYVTGLTKFCLMFLLLQYGSDFFLCVGKLLKISDNIEYARIFFTVWNVIFFPIRILITVLAFFTFSYGLEKSAIEIADLSTGNFNTRSLRLGGMLFVFLTQALMVWNFALSYRRRYRESAGTKSKVSPASKDKKKIKST